MDASSTLNSSTNYYMCSVCDRKYQKIIYSSAENFDDLYVEFRQFMEQNETDSQVVDFIANSLAQKVDETKKECVQKDNKKQIENNALMTTGYDFVGYKIMEYHGIISGNVVIGTGFLSELSAGISDILGSQSDKFSGKIYEAEAQAKRLLVQRAVEVGGNAIIGIQYNYIPFSGNMIGLSIVGTAVLVTPNS